MIPYEYPLDEWLIYRRAGKETYKINKVIGATVDKNISLNF